MRISDWSSDVCSSDLPFGALVAILLVTEIVLGVGAWKAGGIELGHRIAPLAANKPNVQAIGDLLYTRYIFLFEAAGLILLVSMIGAIVLTHRARGGVRAQNVAKQVRRRPEEATRNISQPIGRSEEHTSELQSL